MLRACKQRHRKHVLLVYSLSAGCTYFRLDNPLQRHHLFLDTVAHNLSVFGNYKILVNCIANTMEGLLVIALLLS